MMDRMKIPITRVVAAMEILGAVNLPAVKSGSEIRQ